MPEPITTPKRILVAEDTPSIATLITTVLKNRSYQVALATDGEQCLAQARAFAPNLIILDLMMPGIHGMEVLRWLKADPESRPIGVILCTARMYKSDLDQAKELGVFDILNKPFEKDALVLMVERFFGGGEGGEAPTTPPPAGDVYLPQIPAGRAYYQLWGTRGSIPVSGHRYVRHGGNTSCLEVGNGKHTLIVDAGSGIRELGMNLVKQGPRKLHILITHTHWDHIQGFPFFAPAYVPGFELVIYGAAGFGKNLKSVFSGQLDRDYFPVQFQDMRAKIEFQHLNPSPLEIGGILVGWEYTNHPAATVCFKFTLGSKTLAYVSDNEFLHGYLGAPHPITLESDVVAPHRRLVDFLTGVDLLIGEAQYTSEEYRTKIGWGHSSLCNACLLAKLAKVKRWIVTHHDPLHDDAFLDFKLNLTKEILPSLDCNIEVAHAHDEMMGYL